MSPLSDSHKNISQVNQPSKKINSENNVICNYFVTFVITFAVRFLTTISEKFATILVTTNKLLFIYF